MTLRINPIIALEDYKHVIVKKKLFETTVQSKYTYRRNVLRQVL